MSEDADAAILAIRGLPQQTAPGTDGPGDRRSELDDARSCTRRVPGQPFAMSEQRLYNPCATVAVGEHEFGMALKSRSSSDMGARCRTLNPTASLCDNAQVKGIELSGPRERAASSPETSRGLDGS